MDRVGVETKDEGFASVGIESAKPSLFAWAEILADVIGGGWGNGKNAGYDWLIPDTR